MEISSGPSAAAGRQDFLNLLVTQLRHQDPMSPTKQEDFLAQLAQFSTLEGIETLNENFGNFIELQDNVLQLQGMSSASSMIGQDVAYQAPLPASEIDPTDPDAAFREVVWAGKVEGVVVDGSSISLTVDGVNVPLAEINEIGRIPSDARRVGDTEQVVEKVEERARRESRID